MEPQCFTFFSFVSELSFNHEANIGHVMMQNLSLEIVKRMEASEFMLTKFSRCISFVECCY